jgi:hypothetical protein
MTVIHHLHFHFVTLATTNVGLSKSVSAALPIDRVGQNRDQMVLDQQLHVNAVKSQKLGPRPTCIKLDLQNHESHTAWYMTVEAHGYYAIY